MPKLRVYWPTPRKAKNFMRVNDRVGLMVCKLRSTLIGFFDANPTLAPQGWDSQITDSQILEICLSRFCELHGITLPAEPGSEEE